MSTAKVNHPVIKPWVNQSIIAKSGSTSGTATTEWIDVNGWTDKVVTYDADSSGSIALTITAHLSDQGYYELNNKTATTDDYVAVVLASGVTGAIAARIDADDVDDLQRPIRSIRFKGDNADASNATTVSLTIQGWS